MNTKTAARKAAVFILKAACQFGKFKVGLYLVYDRADDIIGSAAFCIQGWSDEVDAVLSQKFLRHVDLLLVFRVVDCDGVASEHLHYLHAGYISFSVSHIYHMRERNPLVVLSLAFIHLLVVPDAQDSLVDLEQELCLRGIVHVN